MVLQKTFESPLNCKEIQPIHLKGDQSWVFIERTDVEAETLILWLPDAKSWLIGKDPDAGKDWGQEEKGTTEDEMVEWYHWLSGHGFGWTPGVGDGQGGLVCCGSWDQKGSDMTEQLNWTESMMLLTISCSATAFSFCLLSFPFSGYFSMSQLFESGYQSIGVSPSTSALQMWIQGWFPLGLTGLNSLQSNGLSRVFSRTIVQKHQFLGAQFSLWSNSHTYTWPWKNHSFYNIDLCQQRMYLLFNRLSRFVLAFLQRSKHLLISWLQWLFSVILEPKK